MFACCVLFDWLLTRSSGPCTCADQCLELFQRLQQTTIIHCLLSLVNERFLMSSDESSHG